MLTDIVILKKLFDYFYDEKNMEYDFENMQQKSMPKQDKVFAIYFKNDTLNKSETDFSERATFARIHKKKSPCS